MNDGTPRQAGMLPMDTVKLPGVPQSEHGKGCVGWSLTLAAIFIRESGST